MASTREETDIDLEDGECSDNSEEEIEPKSATSNVMSTAPTVIQPKYEAAHSAYRSRIPQIVINSDESDADSDDDYPSMSKRSRPRNVGHAAMGGESMDFGGGNSSQTFVNPLLSGKHCDPSGDAGEVKRKKRKNNIWGSVLTEQVLSQDIKGFGVDKIDSSMVTRDVESYDFRKAHEDDRPELELDEQEVDSSKEDIFSNVVDLEGDVKKQERQKRKRKAKDRLGKRSYDKHKARELGVNDDSETSDVVKAITDSLHEQNIDLFTRIVETVGNPVAIRVFHMTEDVERAGGMMTNDGYRRRTPGGTFIQLLKTDSLVSKEQITHIFSADEERWKEQRKQQRKMKKASRRKWLREKVSKEKKANKPYMDHDRPTTPIPPEDLEVLSTLDGDKDFDATDLPERPATPEPKDDSSDEEEEEEEDEDDNEDISVIIARAKAAILKRQQETANQQDESADMKEEKGSDMGGMGDVLSLDDDGDSRDMDAL